MTHHTGFTGTRGALTEPQARALMDELLFLTGWLHHGDCVGADAVAHGLARWADLLVAIHPPTDKSLMAGSVADFYFTPAPYLARNRGIVDATGALIACPATATEELRSGTWATVRYARRLGRPITLLLPDGTIRREGVTP